MARTHRHIRTVAWLRMTVQAAFAVICAIAGYNFYQFYQWAIGQSDTYIARPAAIEGFLPISALLGLKRFLMTGKWDEIHPAGLTHLYFRDCIGAAVAKSFLRMDMPSWFRIQSAGRIGRCPKTGARRSAMARLSSAGREISPSRLFLYIILWQMDVRAIEAFLYSQYNLVADAKMLLFFLQPSILTLKVLAILLLVSLVVRNFWCRYLCPYGALLGLGALISPLQVKRNASLCIDCKKCEKICPASIRVSQNSTMRHPSASDARNAWRSVLKKIAFLLKRARSRQLPYMVSPLPLLDSLLLFGQLRYLQGIGIRQSILRFSGACILQLRR